MENLFFHDVLHREILKLCSTFLVVHRLLPVLRQAYLRSQLLGASSCLGSKDRGSRGRRLIDLPKTVAPPPEGATPLAPAIPAALPSSGSLAPIAEAAGAGVAGTATCPAVRPPPRMTSDA